MKIGQFVKGALAGFVIGYMVRGACLSPYSMVSMLERKIMQDPARYESVIDYGYEAMHNMKALANPAPPAEGYANFKDLRLVLVKQGNETLTYLRNKKTGELNPVFYADGKTFAVPQSEMERIAEKNLGYVERFFKFFSKIDRKLGKSITKDYEKITDLNDNKK